MTGDAKLEPPQPENGHSINFSGQNTLSGPRRFLELIDFPIPLEFFNDPEILRRARLVCRFGLLGALFGALYATFYLLINHVCGALIIIICSAVFGTAPFLMRRKQSIEPAGHLLILILTLGFTALCFVEGGLTGHAIAWLVSVPLCALLLLDQKAATRWALIAFFAASSVAALELAGIHLPTTYDQRWNPIVSTAGYLGLIIFMFFLGLIFETGRARSFAKMQTALADLAHSNERLVHLNNEKNEFLGIAAHDLKNPLTIILGSAEVAGMLDDQTQVNQLLGNIASAAIRMRDLIANLLDVNAIEQGRFASRLEPCDLGALVEQSVKNNQPGAEKKLIAIQVESTAGLWARADPAATQQILENLISNALKFSSALTTIHLRTLRELDYISVTIRDEGPGISADDQKKLFQKFSRLTARPTGGESSNGLGLAIVKRLAEAMAGTIECQSTPGEGAAFILKLPACPAMSASPPSDISARTSLPRPPLSGSQSTG
jgi:signal transduction histidine kinase